MNTPKTSRASITLKPTPQFRKKWPNTPCFTQPAEGYSHIPMVVKIFSLDESRKWCRGTEVCLRTTLVEGRQPGAKLHNHAYRSIR